MFISRVTKTVTVQASQSTWLDTGIAVQPGEILRETWDGLTTVQVVSPGGQWGPAGNSDVPPGFPTGYASSNVNWIGLVSAIRADGSGQPTKPVSDGLAMSGATAEHVIGAGGRLWLIVNDNNYSDNSGSWNITLAVGRYFYPTLERGKTHTIAAEGTYTRGSGGWNGAAPGGGLGEDDYLWVVDNAAYVVQGKDTAPSGWAASTNGSSVTLTVPDNAAVGQFYSVYVQHNGTYYYAVYHVIAPPPAPPIIKATAILVNNVPTNRLVIT